MLATGLPSSRKRGAGQQSDFFERAVAQIVEQEVRHVVVGDEDVG